MFEVLSGELDGNLSGVSSALANDVATGNAGQFKVDLQALYDYFFGVYDLLDTIGSQSKSLPTDPYSDACLADSAIPGVAAAIQSTVNGALSKSEMSMRLALTDVQGMLAKHLTAVREVYLGYVNADSAGATELTQASNATAAKINPYATGNANAVTTGSSQPM